MRLAVPQCARASCAARTSHVVCSEDLGQLTVPQLKEKLRIAGLKVSGRKAELVQRLLSSDEEEHIERVAEAKARIRPSSRKEAPPQGGSSTAGERVLLVDGMNVGAVLDVPRRTLFAMLHLLCLSRELHTTIIFDGPSFDRVEYESGGLEKGSAEWRALAGRGTAAHADQLPAVEFVGFFAKDAADDVLHERACAQYKSGRTVLMWTFDKVSAHTAHALHTPGHGTHIALSSQCTRTAPWHTATLLHCYTATLHRGCSGACSTRRRGGCSS